MKHFLTQNIWPFLGVQHSAPSARNFFENFFLPKSVFYYYIWPYIGYGIRTQLFDHFFKKSHKILTFLTNFYRSKFWWSRKSRILDFFDFSCNFFVEAWIFHPDDSKSSSQCRTLNCQARILKVRGPVQNTRCGAPFFYENWHTIFF